MIEKIKQCIPEKYLYYSTNKGLLLNGNFEDIIKFLPEKIFDAVITDPPYGVNSNEKNGIDYKDEYFNTKIFYKEIDRVTKNDSRAYIFMSQKMLKDLLSIDFPLKQILIWYKPNFAGGGKKVFEYNSTYENILYYKKGKPSKIVNPRKFSENFMSNQDILKYVQPQSNYKRNKRYHIHQKPIKLLQHLIISSNCTFILDTFSGSGSTGVAAELLNKNWICIEKNKDYCEINKKRLINLQNEDDIRIK